MKRIFSLLLILALLLTALPALGEEPAPIPVIPKEELTPTPKGIHHYMLICMDSWAATLSNPGHTDGLILVSVDEYARRVMLTSFIRDMLIQRPDGKFGRINNIVDLMSPAVKGGKDGKAGIQMLVDTIDTHFNLKIDQFIVVDFQQVENIIDAIGGVDITITAREAQYLKNYPLSASSTTPALSAGGTYHFSGHAAVIYMRIRKVANIEGETQDVGRTRRARIVLTSIADSLKNISEDEALALLDVVVSNTIYTDMTANDMLDALSLALELKGTEIESIRMPIDGSFEPLPVAGMATQQIDYIANREALHAFLLNSFIVVEDEE